MERSICLMGIGNVLMGDDGLGPSVLWSLSAALEFPDNVALVDAGTPGLDLALFLDGVDALIAVDAVHAAGKPGEVRAYRRDEILAGGAPIAMSPHEPTLRAALLRLDLEGRGPREVLLIGAIPERVTAGTGLSETVRCAFAAIEAQIMRELQRLGVEPRPKPMPTAKLPWWEPAVARGA